MLLAHNCNRSVRTLAKHAKVMSGPDNYDRAGDGPWTKQNLLMNFVGSRKSLFQIYFLDH